MITDPLSTAFGLLVFFAAVGAAAIVLAVLAMLRSFWQMLRNGDQA